MWRRTSSALGVQDALKAIQDGTAWAILWCRGDISRSSDGRRSEDDLVYVQLHMIEPSKRERLFEKAKRTGRTKTVVMAESWESEDLGALVLFYESGPYLLPDRSDPFTF
jgi:hypothetical protein